MIRAYPRRPSVRPGVKTVFLTIESDIKVVRMTPGQAEHIPEEPVNRSMELVLDAPGIAGALARAQARPA